MISTTSFFPVYTSIYRYIILKKIYTYTYIYIHRSTYSEPAMFWFMVFSTRTSLPGTSSWRVASRSNLRTASCCATPGRARCCRWRTRWCCAPCGGSWQANGKLAMFVYQMVHGSHVLARPLVHPPVARASLVLGAVAAERNDGQRERGAMAAQCAAVSRVTTRCLRPSS